VRLQALGQAGFVLEGEHISLAIDPYLSDAIAQGGTELGRRFVRRFPPPLSPDGLAEVEVVLITHAHDDHCDPETLVPLSMASTAVRFVGPEPVLTVLRMNGINESRLIRAQVGQPLSLGPGCYATPIPAAHYSFDLDGDGEPAYVGYIIEIDGIVCYHSGDTILFDELDDFLADQTVHIVLLPVNGRDEGREELGIIGNLEPREAFELAGKIGAQLIIPTHNDLFDINRRDIHDVYEAWEKSMPSIPMVWLPPGGEFYWDVEPPPRSSE
jgi:L-ascorbate metabolism protein UlaG (beta-lactamase superfamily)